MMPRFMLSLVILLAAVVYLTGNASIPLWDRDEPRNAQAARQMLTSGDWVVPHFLDKVRTAKPPLTNWCQMTAMRIFGQNSFAARLPSVLGMTGTLILLAIFLWRKIHGDRAFWTVLILASSGIVIGWCARNSLTDGVLLLWMTIAQICLAAALRGRLSWRIVIIWSIAIGFAGLTKGPVVLGVQAMTLVVWWLGRQVGIFPKPWAKDTGAGRPSSRSWWMIPAAIAIVASICGPWIVLVEHRAPGFIWATASRDVIQRVLEPLEQHYGPPGYYLLMVWGIYFPWSVLLPLTFVNAWRHRDEPIIQIALAAVIGPWLMLECVQTKLPHYLLPVFPPLAFLTADAIVRCLRGEHGDLLTRGTRGAVAVWGLIVIGLALTPWFATARMNGSPHVAALAAVLGVIYATAVFALFQSHRPRAALLTMGGGMFAIMLVLFGLFLPRLEQLRLSERVAGILHSAGATHDIQMIAYKEPSLAFYEGGHVREQPKNEYFLNHPASEWPEWTVIREDVWDRMPPEVKDNLDVVGSARGLDLPDSGRTWTVYVVRKRLSAEMHGTTDAQRGEVQR